MVLWDLTIEGDFEIREQRGDVSIEICTMQNPIEYGTQVMTEWGQRSSAQGQRARLVLGGDLPFSPDVFPVVLHPMVLSLGGWASTAVLARRLFAYQDFTYALELDVIAPVAAKLARGSSVLGAEPALIKDALCIAVDEPLHAHAALSVKQEVAARLHITPSLETTLPRCLRSLNSELSEAPSEQRALIELIFSIVSETLITSTLAVLPRDERVMLEVRQAAFAHAQDEAFHHRVFARILEILWSRWSSSERERYAPLLARFMREFLSPDLEAISLWLQEAGFRRSVAQSVIEDTYPDKLIVAAIQNSAQASMRVMQRAGVLQNRCAQDQFASHDLLAAA